MARVLCIFGLLCSVMGLSLKSNCSIYLKFVFFLCFLQQESRKKEDLMSLIQELSKPEEEILYEDLKDTTKQDTSEEKSEEKNRREENDGLTTRPSTKPCRVFFWKSWASC
uniref:Somatostatin/Cortistatin C-terminal domain-containing protein n=1 Tax=Nothobranchius furzeri TaxID=105023 RepID=A0A8C6PC77_NOTFU